MTKKIFRSMVITAGAVLLASLIIIMGCLYEYFCGVQEQQLKDELSLAAAAVEQGGADYLASLQSDRYRLTWVSADGTVLYDTQADAAAMENHAQRQEIRQALLLLAEKYSPQLPMERHHQMINAELSNLAVLEMTIEHLTGKQHPALLQPK